jgi:hypothetical protein
MCKYFACSHIYIRLGLQYVFYFWALYAVVKNQFAYHVKNVNIIKALHISHLCLTRGLITR